MKKIMLTTLFLFGSCSALAYTTTHLDPLGSVNAHLSAGHSAEAFAQLQRIAKTSQDPDAYYQLGQLSEIGQGTKKAPKAALKYYQHAAQKGSALAHWRLYQAYAQGELQLKLNPHQAQQHLDAADRLNLADAQILKAKHLFAQGDVDAGQAKLAPLIAQGNLQASYIQANTYLEQGIRLKDLHLLQTGLNQLHHLGQQGHVASLMLLGHLYAQGALVKQDLVKAKKILTTLQQANIQAAEPALTRLDQALTPKTAS